MVNHANRGPVVVDRAGKWRLYSPLPMPGWEALGTVTDSAGRTGALVRHRRSGLYGRANAGAVSSLPQRKVEAALRGCLSDEKGTEVIPGVDSYGLSPAANALSFFSAILDGHGRDQ